MTPRESYDACPAYARPPRPAPDYLSALSGSEDYSPARDGDAAAPYGRPTIDAIVRRGRLLAPDADPITAGLTDRRYTMSLGLDDVIRQIEQRLELYRLHMAGLTEDELSARDAAQSWFDITGIVDGGHDPELQGQLREIDQRRRDERLSCWRDLSRLRQSLPQWAQDYLAAYRRAQILDDLSVPYGRGDER